MATMKTITMTVRVLFVWWVKFVLRLAACVVGLRIPGARALTCLILRAAWMQVKMDGPRNIGTSWHWMRVNLHDGQRAPGAPEKAS